MQIGKYLEHNQPIIYKTFINEMKKGQLSHAYLLIGNPGTPLFDVAKYLAKSILCDSPSPLACENCITCLRIESANYPDYIVYDGSKENIKKDNIISIQEKFEKKAFENKGIMVYVLHLIENMTDDAINSMLKFLEEPQENVYAFLTTNNENAILSTIVSRCQNLYLKQRPRKSVIEEANNLSISKEDAEWLSYFYNDSELIFEFCNNQDEYEIFKKNKECLNGVFQSLINEKRKDTIYYFQKNIIPSIKSKQSARFFIDMLIQSMEDIINIQNEKDFYLKSYDTILTALAKKLTTANEILIELLKQRNNLNLNINISLLLDHIILALTEE